MKSNATNASAKTSPFTLGSKAKIVSAQTGVRTSNEVKPQIELASQINKFKLNKLGSELMNVVSGNRVKILINTGSEGIDGRYLICVANDNDKNAAKLLSTTGVTGFTTLLFNYSGIYSKMWQATTEASEKGGEAFLAEGVARKTEKGAFYLNEKVTYDIVKVEDVTAEEPLEVDGQVYSAVFACVAPSREEVKFETEVENDAVDTQSDVEVEA